MDLPTTPNAPGIGINELVAKKTSPPAFNTQVKVEMPLTVPDAPVPVETVIIPVDPETDADTPSPVIFRVLTLPCPAPSSCKTKGVPVRMVTLDESILAFPTVPLVNDLASFSFSWA